MSPDAVTDLARADLLPRLHAGATAALQRLCEDAPACAVAAGPLHGRVRFVFDGAAPARPAPRRLLRFRLGVHAGTLEVDEVGLAALCAEPRVDLLPPELRTILVADALHGPAAQLQAALRQRFEWLADDAAGSPYTWVGYEMHDDRGAPLARGRIGFDDPAAFEALVPAFERVPARPDWNALKRLRLPLRLEIGSTPMRWQELRGICRGDIVGIERWRAAGAGLHLSGRLGHLHLSAVSEGARLILHSIGDTMTTTLAADASRAAAADDDGNLPLERLDALEVALRFELGAMTLSLGELRALKPGHVFDLGEPLNRGSVRIVAHGNVLGKGHLVAIGDRLGVRVAEFAAGAL